MPDNDSFADMGNEALVSNIRREIKELNAMIDAAKKRGIHLQSARTQTGHFVIEKAWIERPL